MGGPFPKMSKKQAWFHFKILIYTYSKLPPQINMLMLNSKEDHFSNLIITKPFVRRKQWELSHKQSSRTAESLNSSFRPPNKPQQTLS